MMVQVWDGDSWSTLPKPTSGGTGDRLDGASCLSGSWCVGVGFTSGGSGGAETFVVSLTGPEPEPTTTTTTTPPDEVIPTFAG